MTYFLYHNTIKKVKGFTLVEILIVLGLFSFLMTMATGVLYMTQAINVKLQESQAMLDNANISMDTVSRDIRYGTNFHCTQSVGDADFLLRKSCVYPQGGKVLIFKPAITEHPSDRVAYYASSTQSGNIVLKDEYINGATTTYQITTNDIDVKSLVFYVVGANTSTSTDEDVAGVHDYLQPLIVLTMSGETIPKDIKASSTKFMIQTSISSRGIDK